MKRKLLLVLFAVLIPFVSTGCWDRTELEERLIIVGMAIDCTEDRKIILTPNYVIPEGVGGGEKTAAPQKLPYANTSVEGRNIIEIIEMFGNIISRRPNYEHLKVIIIGEEVARSFNLYELINTLIRHPEMPRNVNVLISEGEARQFFEEQPNIEDIPSFNILMILSDAKYKLGIPPELGLGDISEKMSGSKSFVVQRIAMRNGIQSLPDTVPIGSGSGAGKGDIYEVRGAAVIESGTYMLAGWLNDMETDALNWIMGKSNNGIVEIEQKDTGEIIVYKINRVKTSIKPKVTGNNISFTIESEFEGALTEVRDMKIDIFRDNIINEVEETAAEIIKDRMEKTMNRIQKELKADVADFGKKLSIKYYSVWEQVKDNWEEVFSKAAIDIKVKAYVREFGRKGGFK